MSNLIKWIAGVAAAILAGLIVWWLTEGKTPPDDSSKPPDPSKSEPKVIIKEFSIRAVTINQKAIANFTIYNDGNATATNCKLYWETRESDSQTLSRGPFGLSPGEDKTFQITSSAFQKKGNFKTSAYIKCENCESDKKYKDVSVIKLFIQPRD